MSSKEKESVSKQTKKVTGVKGVYTNEMLQAYLDGEFKQSVLNWNARVGKGLSEDTTCVQIMQLIINQSSRLLEEMTEGLVAYLEKNTTERMDALVDIQFVKVMLDHYYEALDKFTDEDITEASLSFSEDDLLILQIVPQMLSPAVIASQGVNLFNPKRIYIACELILANNDQKYTDDKETMEDWKANLVEGCTIRTTTIDGKDWYSIVRLADGKTMKPYNFKEVVLSTYQGNITVRKYVEEVGKTYKTKHSGDVLVVEYEGANKVLVRFKDTGHERFTTLAELRKGYVVDKTKPKGKYLWCIGDGKYKTRVSGVLTREFNIWKGVTRRCLLISQKILQPTYEDVTVCDEWLNFQNFAEWCNKQKGFHSLTEDGENFQLDKDILVKGNNLYSPDTCCFVPREINNLFTLRKRCRGELPLGVRKFYVKSKQGFRYMVSFSISGKTKSGKTFDTAEEAFQAYKQAKEAYIKEVAEKWKDQIDSKVYTALLCYEIEIND